jgi:surfactin synthase thioesterase subunit
LLLWGQHDPYYAIEEAFAYAQDLERIDMHIYEGPHLLLKTHHWECASMMHNFIADVLLEK